MNPWKASKTGDELPSVLFFSPTTIVASLIQFIRTAPHSLRLSFSLLSSLVSLGVPTLHIVPGGTSTFQRRDDDDTLKSRYTLRSFAFYWPMPLIQARRRVEWILIRKLDLNWIDGLNQDIITKQGRVDLWTDLSEWKPKGMSNEDTNLASKLLISNLIGI